MEKQGPNKLGATKIADDMNYDDYGNLEIDKFGKSMLYKMGWKDDQPIGKNSKGLVKPIEFTPRNHRLGLGAEPLDPSKNIVRYSNAKESKKTVFGTKIKIKEGKHKGLKGKIVDKVLSNSVENFLKENEFVSVELKINNQIVKVESINVKLKHKERSRSRSKELTELKNNINETQKDKLKWVIPNIIVRIISKNSKFYNTKAIIEDVIDKFTFTLITHDKCILNNFTEKDIETVIPKINEHVVIVKGLLKGEKAKLLERDTKKNKAIVQLNTDFTIKELKLDDVCMTNEF